MKCNGKRVITLKGYSNSLIPFPLEIKCEATANNTDSLVLSLLANFKLDSPVHLHVRDAAGRIISDVADCQHNGHYTNLVDQLSSFDLCEHNTFPPKNVDLSTKVDFEDPWKMRALEYTIALAKTRWVD